MDQEELKAFRQIADSDLYRATKRMLDAAGAERNERNVSRGMVGRGGSPIGESATADMYHRQMEAANRDRSDALKKRQHPYGGPPKSSGRFAGGR